MSNYEAIPEFLNNDVDDSEVELNDESGELVSFDSLGREYVGGTTKRPEGSIMAPEEYDDTGGDFPRNKHGVRVFGATLKN